MRWFPQLNDLLLVLSSPVCLPLAISLCLGVVGSLILVVCVFPRRRYLAGFVVFFVCLLSASSLTALMLTEGPPSRDEALLKKAKEGTPMYAWIAYALQDHHITWLEAGLLEVTDATLHPSAAVQHPITDRTTALIRALRHARKVKRP